jgi:hypothetical protein
MKALENLLACLVRMHKGAAYEHETDHQVVMCMCYLPCASFLRYCTLINKLGRTPH